MNKLNIEERNRRRIEAILFVANKPVPLKNLVKVLSLPPDTIAEAIEILNNEYSKRNQSFFIQEVGRGFIFGTRPDYDEVIKTFYNLEEKISLTELNLEVLAIIAYNQPVTRAEVEAVRNNVDSTFHIKTLLEKGFIKIVGRKKVPGNPFLYGTSKDFLTYFGLKNLDDLPKIDEIKEEFKIKGREDETDTLPGIK